MHMYIYEIGTEQVEAEGVAENSSEKRKVLWRDATLQKETLTKFSVTILFLIASFFKIKFEFRWLLFSTIII